MNMEREMAAIKAADEAWVAWFLAADAAAHADPKIRARLGEEADRLWERYRTAKARLDRLMAEVAA